MRAERAEDHASGSPGSSLERAPDAARVALIVALALVWLAALAWVARPAGGLAVGGAPPVPHAALIARGAHAVTLATGAAAAGVRREGRYRRVAGRRWRTLRLGRRARWRVRGLAAASAYLFEIRACRGRRCSHWSRPLRAVTAASRPGTPTPGGVENGALDCAVFPPDNPWNQDISAASVDPNSANYIASIGAGAHLHPDFGSNPSYGIPYTVVGSGQPLAPINFTAYGRESDPGPYPLPANAPVEAGSDRHVLVVQNGACKLYELFNAQRNGAGWNADSGAVFNLRSNALRPDSWTSADAAGLPIFAGLVRRDEVLSGRIRHALRFTVAHTQRGYIHPATHFAASSTNPNLPPMGLRLRLKASFEISGFTGESRVVLQALKTYGMFVADNGSNWYISGATDTRWNDTDLDQLKTVPGSAFEVVQTGPILHNG